MERERNGTFKKEEIRIEVRKKDKENKKTLEICFTCRKRAKTELKSHSNKQHVLKTW